MAFATVRIGPEPFISVDHAGTGEPVVFLHGIGGNKTNWREAMEAVAVDHLAMAWDARGWGDSDDYEGPLTSRDMSVDLLRVLDHFGVAKAHLVGLSMGGRNAMAFAEDFAERVASLTLCDTTLGLDNWDEEKREAFIKSRQAPLLNGGEPADIAEPVARSLLGPNAGEGAFIRLRDSMSALHKHMYVKAIEFIVREPRHRRLSMLDVPALVIVGEHDPITPIAEAREVAAAIPGARLEVVPDAGHLVNVEQPAAFNALLRGFLAEAIKG